MTGLYPLRFEPILKRRVWGGTALQKSYGKTVPEGVTIGESWEISGLEGDESLVANGFLAGNTLNELVEVYMSDLTGESVYEKFGDEFPLLIKLIDAAEYLSVQVHPDDKMAASMHHAYGKTEMWHILEAAPGAKIFCGFRDGIDKEAYLEAVSKGVLPEILNAETAVAGDTFLIPAGMVHAIGPGIVLAEIQQPSDVTYRIFDWNRTGSAGEKRELHTELASEALIFDSGGGRIQNPETGINKSCRLVSGNYFTTNILKFDSSVRKDYNLLDSFVILICTEGKYELNWEKGTELIEAGQTILIPEMIRDIILNPQPNATVLEVFIQTQ
ncbi:MAG: type I phosphomannose isomerase catalytic subunit [Bacteroidales bacterium]